MTDWADSGVKPTKSGAYELWFPETSTWTRADWVDELSRVDPDDEWLFADERGKRRYVNGEPFQWRRIEPLIKTTAS